ncbi:MAG: pyrroline-5-carboxylate reductase [Deltaproteobacteria bacterium]|nr:pyrroline-5-carboxylate reductase [Deltaproteobacteria bacterium]
MMIPVGFIGAGNMGQALIKGVTKKGVYTSDDIIIFDIAKNRTDNLRSETGVKVASSAADLVKRSKVVILAVKPDKIIPVVNEVRDLLKNKLVISIAAGIALSVLSNRLGKDARIIRVMPNTPALVLEGVSGIACSGACTDEDIQVANTIFSAVGICISLEENLLDAITGLSGSGPAFCFMFIEALADGGVRAGLPRDIALKIAAATLKGSAQLVLETNNHPGSLKDMVTSPSGTTIEGISVLEKRGFRSAVMDAVFAAYKRSKEM